MTCIVIPYVYHRLNDLAPSLDRNGTVLLTLSEFLSKQLPLSTNFMNLIIQISPNFFKYNNNRHLIRNFKNKLFLISTHHCVPPRLNLT